jgi:hypothetical protein
MVVLHEYISAKSYLCKMVNADSIWKICKRHILNALFGDKNNQTAISFQVHILKAHKLLVDAFFCFELYKNSK